MDASSIEELEEAYLQQDFGYETTEEIVGETQEAYRKDRSLRGQDVAAIGAAVLKRVLEGSEGVVEYKDDRPTVICLVGVNGSGKTTTTASWEASARLMVVKCWLLPAIPLGRLPSSN